MKVYKWKAGCRINADPQIVGEFIKRLTEENGYLKPDKLVEIASDPNNILYSLFTWDNNLAAQKYRESQARKIIHSLTVKITEIEGDSVRAFVNIVTDGDSVYKSIQTVINNSEDLEYIIKQATRELKAYTQKYNQYQQLRKSIKKVKEALLTI